LDCLRPNLRRDGPSFAPDKGLFNKYRTRNKSGALLLTIRALINHRGDERFTINRAESAVRDGDAQIGEACSKADREMEFLLTRSALAD
jgi:hypothetical protein